MNIMAGGYDLAFDLGSITLSTPALYIVSLTVWCIEMPNSNSFFDLQELNRYERR